MVVVEASGRWVCEWRVCGVGGCEWVVEWLEASV